jgi:hypothetical protein
MLGRRLTQFFQTRDSNVSDKENMTKQLTIARVPVDLASTKFGVVDPIGGGHLTESFLKEASDVVLPTLGFLLLHPDAHKLTDYRLGAAMLAAYAAGAAVRISNSDLGQLENEPRFYARQFNHPGLSHVPNGKFVFYIIERASARGGEVNGQGSLDIRLACRDQSLVRLSNNPTETALQLAFRVLNLRPSLVTPSAAAMAMIVFYSLGAHVDLTDTDLARLQVLAAADQHFAQNPTFLQASVAADARLRA